jgi:hypothetical protein
MDPRTRAALDLLGAHGIAPPEDGEMFADLPDIGRPTPNEVVLPITLDDVFGQGDLPVPEDEDRRFDERLGSWLEDIRGALSMQPETRLQGRSLGWDEVSVPPPEPHCAWYQPMHFFGPRWGIYIREDCVLQEALAVAAQADPRELAASGLAFPEQVQRALRAGFYSFFLHEQFHHKVESLGLRMLATSGTDRYRPYKAHVYRPTFGTAACLEESLANADSYLRLSEGRYGRKLGVPFRSALRRHMALSFPRQPPGYRDAVKYLRDAAFRDGTRTLQSQMLDGKPTPTTPIQRWLAAPDLIRALMDFTAEIYVIVRAGVRPVLSSRHLDPRVTISTQEMVDVLRRHYGCIRVRGGKGSHIKLKGPDGQTVTLTDDLLALPGHEIRQAMRKFIGDAATLGDLEAFRNGVAVRHQAPEVT